MILLTELESGGKSLKAVVPAESRNLFVMRSRCLECKGGFEIQYLRECVAHVFLKLHSRFYFSTYSQVPNKRVLLSSRGWKIPQDQINRGSK